MFSPVKVFLSSFSSNWKKTRTEKKIWAKKIFKKNTTKLWKKKEGYLKLLPFFGWGVPINFELGETDQLLIPSVKIASKELPRKATSKQDSTRFHQGLVTGWTMNFGGCLWCTGIHLVNVLKKSQIFVRRSVKCGLGVLVIDQIWKYVMCTVYMYIIYITVHIRYIIYIYVHIFVSIWFRVQLMPFHGCWRLDMQAAGYFHLQ